MLNSNLNLSTLPECTFTYQIDREQRIALPLHGIPAPSAHGEGGIHRGELLGVH